MKKYEIRFVVECSKSEARVIMERLQDFLDDCHIDYDKVRLKKVKKHDKNSEFNQNKK